MSKASYVSCPRCLSIMKKSVIRNKYVCPVCGYEIDERNIANIDDLSKKHKGRHSELKLKIC